MNNGQILIVDDSDNIRNVLQMNFEWLGYRVVCARDGEEALRMVQQEPPDLIILDVMMPRRNGYQVCRSLKMDPRHRDIPVIFLTAKDQTEDRLWGKDCGADEYLTKPFSAAKLENVIARLLSDREGRDRMGDITARLRALSEEGRPATLVNFRLEPRSLAVYRQKYGELRYHDAVAALRSAIDHVIGEDLPDALVDRDGDGGFRAAFPCDAQEAGIVGSRIRAQGGLLLKSLYLREDVERGYVVTRSDAHGEEVHVPLMGIEFEVNTPTEVA